MPLFSLTCVSVADVLYSTRSFTPHPVTPLRSSTSPLVEKHWNVRIPREHKVAFNRVLPMKGAQSWFITQALTEFIAKAQASDTLRAWVHTEIHRMMYLSPPRGIMEEFLVGISHLHYEQFNELFPELGSTSWFVRSAVVSMIQEMEGMSLEELALQAVASMTAEADA